jgi:adenine C2-methylase RlmN of 23S rRNA A2503 and tRNA A37
MEISKMLISKAVDEIIEEIYHFYNDENGEMEDIPNAVREELNEIKNSKNYSPLNDNDWNEVRNYLDNFNWSCIL